VARDTGMVTPLNGWGWPGFTTLAGRRSLWAAPGAVALA